jgi:DNA-binding transcriptional regulator LsrR (DeoR family)
MAKNGSQKSRSLTKALGARNGSTDAVSIEHDMADDFKTRISWLYYVEGKTQDEIAQIVGTNRSKVLRILAQARADGTVQIKVTSKLAHCVELEAELKEKFGLSTAIVVPSPQNSEDVATIIGQQLGAYLSKHIGADMTVGFGWGTTLTSGIPAIEPRQPSGVSVISMLGGLTKVSRVNPSEFAWRVADRLAAECYMIAAPVFAPDADSRTALMQHPGIAEVIERSRRLDLAVVSAGDLSPNSIFARYGLLTNSEIISLEQAGAIGDVLCRFIDAEGNVIDHPVNDRVLAVHPLDLSGAREVVLASGGWSKLAAIRASMKLLSPSVLITDSVIAERLVVDQV